MEALMQRLEKYKSSEDSAKQAGDSSKARRMGRIVKVVFVLGLFFCLHIGLLFPLVFFISCLSFCFFISKAVASLCIVLALFFVCFFFLSSVFTFFQGRQAACVTAPPPPPPPPPNLPSRFVVIKSGGWWFCGLWGADPLTPHPPPPPPHHRPSILLSSVRQLTFLYNERWHGVLQQYEGAIKSYRAGKPVDFEELPTPPGEILFVCSSLESSLCTVLLNSWAFYFSCSVVQGVHVCVCWIYLTLNSWTFYFSCSVVLYVCTCVCILCLLVCSFVLACVRVHMWACVCVCVCVCVYMWTCTCISVYICAHVNLYILACVCVCVCVCVSKCRSWAEGCTCPCAHSCSSCSVR